MEKTKWKHDNSKNYNAEGKGGARADVGTAGTSRSAVTAGDCPTWPRGGLNQGRAQLGEAHTALNCCTTLSTAPRTPHRAPDPSHGE